MSTVDRALALLTGDEPQPAQPPSHKTIEKAVAWEIEDEIAAKTGRARFGPLQALAGDLDALEESIKEVDAWLAKNVDDLDGVDAAVRDVSDDTKTNEVVTENLEALDRVLAKIVATAPQGLSLHPRAEKAFRPWSAPAHRTARHRTAPHRTSPHRTAPHRTAPHRLICCMVHGAQHSRWHSTAR